MLKLFKRSVLNRRCKFTMMSTSQNFQDHWHNRDGEHKHFEEVLGEQALSWVHQRNDHCLKSLGDPTKDPVFGRILSILDSKDKIPSVTQHGAFVYNFWQDELHVKGIYRRTTLDMYKTESPAWETVLDLDELSAKEGESWVFKGIEVYRPSSGEPPSRAMVHVARGGSDATVVREFDLNTCTFVDNGFHLPEAKSYVSWADEDILLVGTDLHDGVSMTASGYPRVVREWRRGSELSKAEMIYEGEEADVSVHSKVWHHGGFDVQVTHRSLTFYTSTNQAKVLSSSTNTKNFDGNIEFVDQWVNLDTLPIDIEMGQFADQMLLHLRSDWTVSSGEGAVTFKQGSLLSIAFFDYFRHRNSNASLFTVLFTPTSRISLNDYTVTRNYLIVSMLDTVKDRLQFWKFTPDSVLPAAVDCVKATSHQWEMCGGESEGVVRGSTLSALDKNTSDEYWITISSFLKPSQLLLANAADGPNGLLSAPVKSLPPQFDSSELIEKQYEATSADGTKIPYFVISRRDIPLNGSTPTLLYGYGGFEISLVPVYSPVVGCGWLEKGGCFVYANIRGGGEFGPSWHQSAKRENRYLAYDDFIGVAEDLIARGVTTSGHLAIRGGSNGGLLMGNMFTRRPDLFGAVVCAVPLLDMKRYSHLLAGNSWMAEYGNPDTEDWEFLKRYSAYHNIDPSGDVVYPPLLMTTSTRDDRVHPYHARCFVQRVLDVTLKNTKDTEDSQQKVFYYENCEGGHGGAADNKQVAFMNTLYLDFLWKTIA